MDEMNAHNKIGTWEIVDLPRDKKTAQCKLVFMVKCKVDGNIERTNAKLVAKGYTQHKHKPME